MKATKKVISLFLFLSLSGLLHLGTQALAQTAATTKTSIRHLGPTPTAQTSTFKIEAFIEGGPDISEVYLWSREKGDGSYKKTVMKRLGAQRYETTFLNTEEGIEYYIEVLDTNGLPQNDGSREKPYFFQSAAPEPQPPFQLSTAKSDASAKKPFWKKTWFWVGVAAVIGGGFALADSGDDDKQSTGTVTVE